MFKSATTILARMCDDASKNLYKLADKIPTKKPTKKYTKEQSKVVADIARKFTAQRYDIPLLEYKDSEEIIETKKDDSLMSITINITGSKENSYKAKIHLTTDDFVFGSKVYQSLKHIFSPVSELNQISMMENVGQGYQFTVFDIDSKVKEIDTYIYDLLIKTCKNNIDLESFKGYFIINHEFSSKDTNHKYTADKSITIDEPTLFKEALEIAITQTDDAWDNFYNTMSLISRKMTQCGYGEAMKTFNTALNTFHLNRRASSYSSDKYNRNDSYITTRIYS